MATFVLCHGGWAGGWQWRTIPDRLRTYGHTVYTPTFTGCGERIHLGHPDVNLETHITDIVNLFRFEQLQDAILVGYSYSGMVITGVADQIPEQIAQLVYLDAFVPVDGQSLCNLFGESIATQIVAVAERFGDGWKVPYMPDPNDPKPGDPRLLTHPLQCALQAVRAQNPTGLTLPRSYIYCTEDKATMMLGQPLVQAAQMAKANLQWHYYELTVDHRPIEDAPDQLTALLLTIATRQ